MYSEPYEHNQELKANKTMTMTSIQFQETVGTKPLFSNIVAIRKLSLLSVPSLLCVRMIIESIKKVLWLEQKVEQIPKRQISLTNVNAHEWHPHNTHKLTLPLKRQQVRMGTKTEI